MWMQRSCPNMKLTDMKQDNERDLVSWHVAAGAPEHQVEIRESRPEAGTKCFILAATGVLTCTLLAAPGDMLCGVTSRDPSEPPGMISGSPFVDEHGKVFGVYTTGSKVGDEAHPDRFLVGGVFIV
jgi:hypothetical protein